MSEKKSLIIDVPVVLDGVKVVFSVASLSFEGDMPAPFVHIGYILDDTEEWESHLDAVVVFHTNAGHVSLHDEAYNKDRNVRTGNPYKKLTTDLIERGVRVELCGKTAASHGWNNADTIPGIKINTDAMARLTQLVQEGFVKITES